MARRSRLRFYGKLANNLLRQSRERCRQRVGKSVAQTIGCRAPYSAGAQV